jgi:hypothetical protein
MFSDSSSFGSLRIGPGNEHRSNQRCEDDFETAEVVP